MEQIEMRKLNASDIFPMSTILSKIGLKELKACFSGEEVKKLIKNRQENITDDGLVKEVGITVAFELANVILSNLSNIENDLYKFFARVTEKTEKEIKNLSMAEFTDLIIRLVQKEEFMDFFKVVSKLLK